MSFPKRITDIITKELPDYLIQERDAGKQTLSYISGSTVIDILNKAFDYQWDWEITNYWIQESAPKFVAKSNFFTPRPDKKVEFSGKEGEMQEQPSVAHVVGVLTVYFIDDNGKEQCLIKTGCGSKTLIGGASEQESIFKAASTDALKKAASLLGIGAQLYRNEDEKYFFEKVLNNEWTDAMNIRYKEEKGYLNKYMKDNKLDANEMTELLIDLKTGIETLSDIVPGNIEQIVMTLKNNKGKK